MPLNFDSQNTQNVFCDAQKGVKNHFVVHRRKSYKMSVTQFINRSNTMFA